MIRNIKKKRLINLELNKFRRKSLADQRTKIGLQKKVKILQYELEKQFLQVRRLNESLLNVHYLLEDQQALKGQMVSFSDFQNYYPNEESCLAYLARLKWEQGFKCRKCSNKNFKELKKLSRRCTCCGYLESPTSYTLFHHLRFPIVKAFYIVYLAIYQRKISSEEVSTVLQLRKQTYHDFRKKTERIVSKTGFLIISGHDWKLYLSQIVNFGFHRD